jgi:hypothetical protein
MNHLNRLCRVIVVIHCRLLLPFEKALNVMKQNAHRLK